MSPKNRRLTPRPFLPALVILCAAGALHAPSASAQSLDDAMELGVAYMASIQGTYAGQVRVNPGPPGTTAAVPAIENVWEWEIGTGLAYSNTWGASALGVALASGQLADPLGGAAAASYASELVDDFADTGAFMRSETYAYGPDVELLARLGGGRVSGCRAPRIPPALRRDNANRRAFSETAQDWLANFPSGAAEADRIIDGRTAGANGDLAGWDVARVITAGLAAGDVDFACDAAERVLERRPDWEGSSPAYLTDWWRAPSEAGLAHALSLLDATGACGDFSAEVRDLRDRLHARVAASDGGPYTGVDQDGAIVATYAGFDYPGTQNTAYGVLGFLGCCGDATPEDRAAAARGLGFLVRAQNPPGTGAVIATPVADPRSADGAWPAYPTFWSDDSNGEINGEALMALALGSRCRLEPAELPERAGASSHGDAGTGTPLDRMRTVPDDLLRVPAERAPVVRATDAAGPWSVSRPHAPRRR